MPDAPQGWVKDTPAELLPAVKHIRREFEERASKCSKLTQKLCYAALHPDAADPDIGHYIEAFAGYRQSLGTVADKEFDRLWRVKTPPAVFKAFFEIHREGLRIEIRWLFNDLLQIGVGNKTLLQTHPAQWAQEHLRILLYGRKPFFAKWVKEACDKQQQPIRLDTDEEFEESIFWKSWRAPKLIHMQPAGNTPYDPETAWNREDEVRSQQLLDALSQGWFIQLLEIDLERTAGLATVRLAKTAQQAQGKKANSNIRSPYKLAIRQALTTLGLSVSAQSVATWIAEKYDRTEFEHIVKRYGQRKDVGHLYRTDRKFSAQFDRDVSDIRKLLKS